MSISQCVKNGVEFLNKNAEDKWWDKIDLKTFNISDATLCVLGQVFNFQDSISFFLFCQENDLWNNGGDYGFDVLEYETVTETLKKVSELQNEWVRVITELQGK